jgi:hypothetical protein
MLSLYIGCDNRRLKFLEFFSEFIESKPKTIPIIGIKKLKK